MNTKILRCFIVINVTRIQWSKICSNIDICNYFPNIRIYRMRCKNHSKVILDPVSIYLFKVYNRNTRKRCEVCSELTPEERQSRRSGIFIVNFKHIPYHILVFLLLNLNWQKFKCGVFCFSSRSRWTSLEERNRIF